MSGAYYASLVSNLCDAIKGKHSGNLGKGVLLHQDIAQAIATAAITKSVFEILATFRLFPKLFSEVRQHYTVNSFLLILM